MTWKSAFTATSGGLATIAFAIFASAAHAEARAAEISICGSSVTAKIDEAGTAEAHRSFLGVWTGEWSRGRICSGLIVKKVDAHGDAFVDYLYRPAGQTGTNLNTQSIVGHVESNQTLTFNDKEGSRFSFALRPGSDMTANFVNASGTRLETAFHQVTHPTLPSQAAAPGAPSTSQETDIGSLRPGTYVDGRVPCSQAANATLMWFDGRQFNAGRFCPATLEPGQKGPVVTISRDNCPEEYGPDHPKMVRRVDTFSVLSPTEFVLKTQYGEESRKRYCVQTELPAMWRGTYAELQRGARETAQAAPTTPPPSNAPSPPPPPKAQEPPTASVKPSFQSTDPIIEKLAMDIRQPIFFILSVRIKFENNDELVGKISGDKLIIQGNLGDCRSPNQEIGYKYMPKSNWLAGNVLQKIAGNGLRRLNENDGFAWVYDKTGFKATPSLLRLARQRCVFHDGAGHDAGTYSVYDLGKFELTGAEIANEFTAPDRQTGANTKFRSYKVTVEFQANPAVAALAGAQVLGHATWTVAWGMNPITLQWVYAQFGDGTWSRD